MNKLVYRVSLLLEVFFVTLPIALNDREYQKFEDTIQGPAVRVTGTNFSGNFTPGGLQTEGRYTDIVLDSILWTVLPATALTARNHISIQNLSGIEIKINFDPTTVGYVGYTVPDGITRHYDITDDIFIYAKAASGTPTIGIEELA